MCTVPEGPDEIFVFGGERSIVHPHTAGVGSVLPAFVARTLKAWRPAARPLYAFGEVHTAKVPPSTLHWKVELASDAVNVKVAERRLVKAGGLETIAVSGGVGLPYTSSSETSMY